MGDELDDVVVDDPHAGLVYLVHEQNVDGAGWYEPRVADVLLDHGTGWHRADPATGEALAAFADSAGHAADAAELLGDALSPKPPAESAHKQDWVDWAVTCGAEAEAAEAMTKAELVDTYANEHPSTTHDGDPAGDEAKE